MSWHDPRPFLRGVAWLDEGRAVRANPSDLGRLPWDTAQRAALPIGVRLEFTAEGAHAVQIRYRASVPRAADALRAVAHCFALWHGDSLVSETIAEPAEETVVTVALPAGVRGRFIVHPPEAQSPMILGLRGIGGSIAPAPPQPRWLVHGDSITEGWWSTRPAHSWPATAGRTLGLDTVNLGYAGAARGELATAEQLSALPADAITLAFGTNCWTGVPCSAPLLYETVRAFLKLVRQGHPQIPLLVLSPVLRPQAEQTPNRLGATLAELRTAIERAVLDSAEATGDGQLALLPGRGLIGPSRLADGVHPNDEGHAAMAAAVADVLRTKLS
ncbi:lysophospholipase L1-like esterase [Streptomyces sp. SLBN-118]|uniref:GDSL-type esterase/lipase family protein n=1 Tax=Streptomyces sp. SLBN-118 TaxID=2768454 RepID=UPI00114EA6D7|nr:GDSL-type esterase/lipase family protein [Streptomyces sp. SLBN-118]TQK43291.1 lysophospholipase L1-like esterase [Streptomyces sp. SLBN-118]